MQTASAHVRVPGSPQVQTSRNQANSVSLIRVISAGSSEPRKSPKMASVASAQINTKERVTDHGEVLTGEREVTAMLDMVEHETLNIESRFLEPACGNGNFLDEVLRRKLTVVESRYKRSQLEWERYALLAVTSIYGIDILPDNVQACQERLFERIEENYRRLFKRKIKVGFLDAATFVLSKNIIWGDALSLKKCDGTQDPIVFSEWSPVNGSLIKRKDFAFEELLPEEDDSLTLFGSEKQKLKSDTGQSVFLPTPIREFPPVHFLRLRDE